MEDENSNCKKCVHRTEFVSQTDGGRMFICTSEPCEEDEDFDIITWLDVKSFHSDECINFKQR